MAQDMPQCTQPSVVKPTMRSIHCSLAVLAGFAIGCAGLDFSAPGLDDVTAAQALEKGYTVPASASHVSAKDYSSIDVRTTWLRYEVPAETLDDLIATYSQNGSP